jgi:hypothetical protein
LKRTPIFFAAFLVAAVSLSGAVLVFAQDAPMEPVPQQQEPQFPGQPKPAGRQYRPFAGDQDTGDEQSLSTLKADTTPLTGALIPDVGSQEMRHSYWVPGFQYGNFIRSSRELQPFTTNWNSTSFVAGNLSLLQNWGRSQFALNYSGGGSFSTDEVLGNSYYHQLGAVQNFNWRRTQLSLIDHFSYLPQTQFGFGAATNLANPGVGGAFAPAFAGLQSSYQPIQTIFAAVGSRYSNSTIVQLVHAISTRGSVTLTGSYGILRFVESGNIDSNDAIFSAGYDYALSKNDSVGVLYRMSTFHYPANPQAIQDQAAQLAYGRKVTGRLALQLFVGPERTNFRTQTAGFTDRTSVSGGANLTFFLARTNVFVSYNHGVSGGSGVYAGSNTDTVQGTFNRQLSRIWRGNISSGYSRNATLAEGNIAVVSPTFHTSFAGAGLERPLGRTADLTFGYTAYLQDTSQGRCATDTCRSYLQHQLSVSFQWHTRPLVLR